MKIFAIILVLILGTFSPLFGKGNTDESPKMEANSMMAADETMEMEVSPFITYENMNQVKMLSDSKPTVLFFKADWCPSCKAAAKDFTDNSEQLKDVNLVVVDYDHSDDLQVKYGVTYQHTFVQISPSGDAITKWNGGGTTDLLMKIVSGGM